MARLALQCRLSTPRPVVLAWDASLSNAAGYNLYYGRDPGTLLTTGTKVNVGNVLIHRITPRPDPGTWYFGVTAYDSAGNEGGFSNIVQTHL